MNEYKFINTLDFDISICRNILQKKLHNRTFRAKVKKCLGESSHVPLKYICLYEGCSINTRQSVIASLAIRGMT